MISLMVGRGRNGAIGKDNDIPWHVPEDLKAFQRETLGGAIIMGRNTWDSLPVKPLKNRMNIVVTRQPRLTEHQAGSVEEAIAIAYAAGYRRVYGIGGAGIYRAMMPLAERLLVTEVDLAIEDADTFFPDFSEEDWRRIGTYDLRAQDPTCVLHEYLRR
ncbi:dihydrofolate reductase [Shimia sp. FJ5]|uniref:dihydrofolate reductase n=1 Tax=Shimia sp. FJ5 TaxID=3079054 RepID=UPI00262E56E8|nr:dihydrofolate reductase [Shimia sp. FJ5]MDV4145418.1 dihydrofolate reductase [Shimia sp. FJ5]